MPSSLRRSLLALGTLAFALTLKAPAQTQSLKAAVDSLLDARVAADRFSGAVLIARENQILYERAAGLADRERGEPMTLDTRLEIASMTKLLTKIAVFQLVQAGKLSLSDTVGRFLPDYPNPVVRSQVTVALLLDHRSGIGSFWNEEYLRRRAELRSVEDYLALFQRDSLLFAPGTNQTYSNGGYVVLGAIIERVSGKSYDDYVQERILRPAGMTRTAPYDRRASLENTAVGYTSQPLGGPTTGDRRLAGPGPAPGASGQGSASGAPRRPNTEIQPGRSSPAGGHLTTVGDLFRLAKALTGRRLLDSTHTTMLFGARYARGEDFRSNGGGPGVNAEFSLYPSGYLMVVLSNYDPPTATEVAQYLRSLIGPPAAPAPKSLLLR